MQNLLVDERVYGSLPVGIYADKTALGRAAAEYVAGIIQAAVAQQGHANVILATGNSMLTYLSALVLLPGIPWEKVQIFHMDEYIGLPADHPASFRRYLHENILDIVHPAQFYGIDGTLPDPVAECKRYTQLLRSNPADLCCLGIGENGHLAFNDPGALFDDPEWVKIVELDVLCRMQQVGEGHFPTLESVPPKAITLTIPALLAAKQVVGIVPEQRKAIPVRAALTGPVSSACPASILRTVSHARLFLDRDSASLL